MLQQTATEDQSSFRLANDYHPDNRQPASLAETISGENTGTTDLLIDDSPQLDSAASEQVPASVATQQQNNQTASVPASRMVIISEEELHEFYRQRTLLAQNAVMTGRSEKSLSWWLLLTGFIATTALSIFLMFGIYQMYLKVVEVDRDNQALRGQLLAQPTSPNTAAPAPPSTWSGPRSSP